jgi:hypothetical protein
MSAGCIITGLGFASDFFCQLKPFQIAELHRVCVRIETQAFSSIREAGRVSESRVRRLESELCDDVSGYGRGWADGSRDGIGRR